MLLSATVLAVPHTDVQAAAAAPRERWLTPLCAALTLCVPLIHGYHPDAEDGGIYLAGIKYCLHPELYPHSTGFVTAHVQFSPFAHAVAALASIHPPALMGILFALYLLTTFLTLLTAGSLTKQLTIDVAAQRWSVVLLAACLTLPVAGTSLMLMDPYVTARSLALPCVLGAMAATLRLCAHTPGKRDALVVALALLAAIVLHPLSGGYGTAAVAVIIALSRPSPRARIISVVAIVLSALAACIVLRATWSSVPAGYSAIAQSRTYWALGNWAWYEVAGLIAPLLLLLRVSRANRLTPAGRVFARSLVVAGLLATAISLLFVHADGPSFAVARVQPLRIFQYIYLALPLCLGSWLATRITSNAARTILCTAVALCMFATQRTIYAHSNHVEWPWAQPKNDWQQAFLWVRANSSVDAIIATDAHYITEPGEDAHNIRAITERSTPADVSKDGGIAAIRPSLTRDWQNGVALQRDLATVSDSERLQRLAPHSIQWLILPRSSQTNFPCPYRNSAVSVCRVMEPPNFVRTTK